VLLEILYTICALNAATPCHQERVGWFVNGASEICVMQAGSEAVQWEKDHPAWRIRTIICRRPYAESRI
jgi:hypothetical protein